MANNVSVRSYLQGKGVASGDIGYDQNSGNVTVGGQNFIKPSLNMANTTYDSQQNLDGAYGNYTKTLPVIPPRDSTAAVTTGDGSSTVNSTDTGKTIDNKPVASTYSNPYTSMIADVMKHLTDTYNAPQQDIYSSPQYAAAKANQDRQSADATRQANEAAAGAGLGHSTIMTDRSQKIQDDSNNYLATQLVPQIQSQMAAQKQQDLQNQQAQLNNYFNLSQQSDSNHNADRTFDAGREDAANTHADNVANMTGDYTSPEVSALLQKQKENSAAYATATPEQQAILHQNNIDIANQLGESYNPKTGQYSGGNYSTRTVQGQQLDSDLATGKIDKETAQFKLDQLKDPNSPLNQANDIDLQLKKLDLKNAPEEERLKLKQLQKTIAQIGAAPYQSDNDKAMDSVKLQIAQEQLKELQNPKDSTDMSKELEGLFTGLSSGQITAFDANAEIDQRLKAGLDTSQDAAKMKAFIQKFQEGLGTPADKNSPKLQVTPNDKLFTMNNDDLEKAWSTDPTGQKSGRAMYDWMKWIRDQSNGYKSGNTFEIWKSKYGPTMQ